MTATAQRAHEEFREFYGLHIAVIPSNKTCIERPGCAVYATKKDKISAIINEIIESHKENDLCWSAPKAVKDSEEMADILISKGISCEVLNAKMTNMRLKSSPRREIGRDHDSRPTWPDGAQTFGWRR